MHQRGDAVSSIVYEADARVRDPVYGCVSAISSLQQQIAVLQNQLAVANAEIVCMRMQQSASTAASLKSSPQATPPSELSTPMQPRSPELQLYKPAMKALEKGEAVWTWLITKQASKQSVNMELYYTDDVEVFWGERKGTVR